MKKENKKNKKKKYLKILLGVGVAATALLVAKKYNILGFDEKIVKPVQGFAKNIASDVKESVLKEERQKINNENTRKPEKRFNREPISISEPRKNFNNDKMNRCGNRNNRRDRFEKKNFN